MLDTYLLIHHADISIVYLHTFDFTVDIQTRLDLFQTKHFCFQVKMFSLGNWPGSFSGGGVTPVYNLISDPSSFARLKAVGTFQLMETLPLFVLLHSRTFTNTLTENTL